MPNLLAALRTAARNHPERIAIRSKDTAITFAQLLADAVRFGHELRGEGVTLGDRVALALPNIPRYAVAYYGTLLAGGVAVPLNPANDGAVLAARLRDANPGVLVVAHGPPDTVSRAAAEAGVTVLESTATTEVAGAFSDSPAATAGDDTAAVIAYKSSDVEEPIGVVLSHRNLAWSATAAEGVLGLVPSDTLATHFPLFHPLGLTYGLAATVAAGCTLALPAADATSALDVLESAEATVLSTFPMLIGAASSENTRVTPKLRTVFCSGGVGLTPRVFDRLAARLGCEVLAGYGTVEMSVLGCAARSGQPAPPGSMGPAVPGVELAVVDARGREAPARRAGSLVARGPNVMTGYWERPRETARAVSNGWLITGEKARRDTDGNIFLLGNGW